MQLCDICGRSPPTLLAATLPSVYFFCIFDMGKERKKSSKRKAEIEVESKTTDPTDEPDELSKDVTAISENAVIESEVETVDTVEDPPNLAIIFHVICGVQIGEEFLVHADCSVCAMVNFIKRRLIEDLPLPDNVTIELFDEDGKHIGLHKAQPLDRGTQFVKQRGVYFPMFLSQTQGQEEIGTECDEIEDSLSSGDEEAFDHTDLSHIDCPPLPTTGSETTISYDLRTQESIRARRSKGSSSNGGRGTIIADGAAGVRGSKAVRSTRTSESENSLGTVDLQPDHEETGIKKYKEDEGEDPHHLPPQPSYMQFPESSTHGVRPFAGAEYPGEGATQHPISPLHFDEPLVASITDEAGPEEDEILDVVWREHKGKKVRMKKKPHGVPNDLHSEYEGEESPLDVTPSIPFHVQPKSSKSKGHSRKKLASKRNKSARPNKSADHVNTAPSSNKSSIEQRSTRSSIEKRSTRGSIEKRFTRSSIEKRSAGGSIMVGRTPRGTRATLKGFLELSDAPSQAIISASVEQLKSMTSIPEFHTEPTGVPIPDYYDTEQNRQISFIPIIARSFHACIKICKWVVHLHQEIDRGVQDMENLINEKVASHRLQSQDNSHSSVGSITAELRPNSAPNDLIGTGSNTNTANSPTPTQTATDGDGSNRNDPTTPTSKEKSPKDRNKKSKEHMARIRKTKKSHL